MSIANGFLRCIVLAAMFILTLLVEVSHLKAQTCALPKALTYAVPSGNVSTCATPNVFSSQDACANTYMNGPEYVFSYEPSSSLDSCVSISLTHVDGDLNKGLFVFDGCPNIPGVNCIAQRVYKGAHSPVNLIIEDLKLNIGKKYIIVVASTANCHDFSLIVGPGTCPAQDTGTTCSSARVIGMLPFTYSATTCGANDDYNQGNNSFCVPDYTNSEDYVFKYIPVENECVAISLTKVRSWSAIHLMLNCPTDTTSVCIQSALTTGVGAGNVSSAFIDYAFLWANKTYYIVVSSSDLQTNCTDFDIAVKKVNCCGIGSNCSNPDIISSLPFSQKSMSTCNACNDFNFKMGCFSMNKGDDYVYTYTPIKDECVAIGIKPVIGGVGSPTISLFNGCPEDKATICVGESSNNFLNASLLTGETYYIVLSKDFDNCYSYDINVYGTDSVKPGTSCSVPYIIPSLPFTQESMTSACYGNEYNPKGKCGVFDMNGDDFIYKYNSPGGESVMIDVSNQIDESVGIYVFDGCPDNPASNCLASNKPSYSFQRPVICDVFFSNPGTYYIMIDKRTGFTNFDINIRKHPVPGGNCSNPHEVPSLPFFEKNFQTSCFNHDYSPNPVCGTAGVRNMTGNDYVFAYDSKGGESVNIELFNSQINMGLYVTYGCPDDPSSDCLGFYDSGGKRNGLLCNVSLIDSGRYYIIVDHSLNDKIPFDIAISSANSEGKTCSDSYPVPAIPFVKANMTTKCSGNNYTMNAACGGTAMNGEDFVFKYSSSGGEALNIELLNTTDKTGLFVTYGCPDTATSCIGKSPTGTNPGLCNVNLTDPGDYYIIVDSRDANSFTPFDISIKSGNQPGISCSNPYAISAIPFNGTGFSTKCFGADYSPDNKCGGPAMNGEDFVFAYTSPGGEVLNIQLFNTQTRMGLFLLNDCPDNPSSTCIAFDYSNTEINPALCGVELSNPGTYYIIVDRESSFSSFDIDIKPANQPGMDCTNPYVITIPFNGTGLSTRCYANDFILSDLCPGGDSLKGEDMVFTYNSPGGEGINIKLFNTRDRTGIYVLSGCPDNPASACIASAFSGNRTNPSLCGVDLNNPGMYYIIVDRDTGFTGFDIIIESSDQPGATCSNPYLITALPYAATGLTTECFLDDYNAQLACGKDTLYGEDVVFEYFSPGNEVLNVSLLNTATEVGVSVYYGCPGDSSSFCVASKFSGTGKSPKICGAPLINAGAYYIVVDRSTGFTPFNITIDQEETPGIDCNNPYIIPASPYSETGFTTDCYGSFYDSTDACGSAFLNGDEFVFEFINPKDQCLAFTAANLTAEGGIFLLNGCPDDPGVSCVAQMVCDEEKGCNKIAVNANLAPGAYYIIVSAKDNDAVQNFDFSVDSLNPNIMSVLPEELCVFDAPFILNAVTYGGTWSGPGITNPVTGAFDPFVAGEGNHTVIYAIGTGSCAKSDTLEINVGYNNCSCNLDIEKGNFTYWSAFTGICCPIAAGNPGIVGGRHTLMTAGGTDPITGGLLPTVDPEGNNFSIKLGNDKGGSQAEKLRYRFHVTPENAKFGFRYAIVIQDGGITHGAATQARFEVTMRDESGDVIPCGTSEFIASANVLTGFTPSPDRTDVQFKPWSLALVDLTAYTGQNITVEFASGDCFFGGHFGYGYVDGLCEPVRITGNNYCKGEAAIALSAPPGFLTYQWNTFPPQFTQDIVVANPVSGTSYTVTVTPMPGGVGCPVDLTTVLYEVSDPIVNAGSDETICEGDPYTSSASISGSSYYVNWQTNGTGSFNDNTLLNAIYTPSAADIASGNVQLKITVFDSTLTCSASDSMTLFINPADDPSFNYAASSYCPYDADPVPNITGGFTGSFSSSPAGLVFKDASTGEIDVDVSAQGAYAITFTTNGLCPRDSTVTIIIGLPEPGFAVNDPSCSGLCDGQASVIPSGGTPPYTYSWSGGGNDSIKSGLCAGVYIVTVQDQLNCLITDSVTVIDPDDIVLNFSASGSVCGQSNGEACVTASGGKTPYTYEWNDPGNQTTQCITKIPSRNYTVIVTDNTGCTATGTIIVEELPIQPIVIDSVFDVSCSGAGNGSIFLTTTGMVTPYTYSWSNGAATEDITGLSAGTYTLAVTDANNCISTTSVEITEPSPLSADINYIKDISCYSSNDGTIGLAVTGGTKSYSYSWSNGSTVKNINNLKPGNYVVTVTDKNGCTDSASRTLIEPPPLSVEISSVNHIACNGSNSGSIEIMVSGGTGSYNYSWSNGANTKDISNLAAGNYSVTITDENSCTATIDTSITEFAALSVTIDSIINASCGGVNDGAIAILATGGIGNYSYTWSNGAGTEDISNLEAGQYSVTVTDESNCSVTLDTAVTEPEPVSVEFTNITHVSCYGENNGSANIVVTGGTGPYSYTWNPSVSSGAFASRLAPGTYNLEIEDDKGCKGTAIITINASYAVNVSVSAPNTICEGEIASIDATVNGGIPPYTYAWEPGITNGNPSVSVSPSVTTTYTVSVTDSNGCAAPPDSITISLNALPVISFIADPENGCAPLCVSLSNTTLNTKSAIWAFGDGTSGNGSLITHCYENPGKYTIELAVTDSNECFNQLSSPNLITVFPDPIADFKMNPPVSGSVNSPVLFIDASTGADHWLWNFGDPLNTTSELKNPEFIYNLTGSYVVNLTVSNDNGCTDTVSHTIIIESDFTLYIPNTFTPDNDGLNDYFKPEGTEFTEFEMEIYNRWGEKVYQTKSSSLKERGWDGTFKDKHNAPQDVYMYKIRVKDLEGESYYYVGNVMLLR